jgi:Fe-S-cluster-containing hydrogenase component 2
MFNKVALSAFQSGVQRLGDELLKSKEVEKFRYDKTVYVVAVGKCGTCYYCVNACPENAIKEWNPPTVDNSLCTRCMKCVEACPRDVMKIIR